MAGTPGLARARERIERAGRSGLDPAAVRQDVLAAVRDAVPFDAYVWVLTDPETTVGVAPLADIPAPAFRALPELIRARYLAGAHRWTGLLDLPHPVAVLRTGPGEGGPRTWPELLSTYGVTSVACVAQADAFGCWGFLDLWRLSGSAEFGPDDEATLAALAPIVTAVLREGRARGFAEPAAQARPDVEPVVLTLDDDLRVLTRTSTSRTWLDRLLPPEPGAAAVPASVLNVAAQLLAIEAGADDHAALARTPLTDGVWLTLRAARIHAPEDDAAATASTSAIVVTIDETSAPERLSLFCRIFGLTARESELVALLASGADTRAIARRLQLSELTVQDHLKSVFAKTGTHDRLTVVARAVGTRPVDA